VRPELVEAELRARLRPYAGPETERLLGLCLRDRGRLWGHDHVEILAEVAGLPDDDPAIPRLAVPYVLLSTHYFLLDAAVDGHAEDPTAILATTQLLFLVATLVGEVVLVRVPPADRPPLLARVADRLAENAAAVRIELERRRGWEPPDELDRRAGAGRSNSTLLFYDLLCALAGGRPDPAAEALFGDLLYYLQLGDDLGDWRGDLETGNHTMLIRECAARLPPDSARDPASIERELLLGGCYELYTSRLINQLDGVLAELRALRHLRTTRLQAYVLTARERAHRLLTDVLATKLRHASLQGAR
jgi:hypothetical protein